MSSTILGVSTSAIASLPSCFFITLLIPLLAVALTLLIPSQHQQGAQLHNKTHILYKTNGLWVVFTASILFLLGGNRFLGLWRLEYLAENWGALLVCNVLFNALFTAFLTFVKPRLPSLCEPEASTKTHYKEWYLQYWCGTELNPHIFNFELKFFWYRPGFILWSLLNISFWAKQMDLYQATSVPMLLYQFISYFYIVDAFWHEIGMAFMFDIIEENFGFMLVWGDYCWIPFVFSLPAMFCVDRFDFTILQVILCLCLFGCGFSIFRGANAQKFQFKQDAQAPIWGETPKTIESPKTGRLLLCSGWWGVARKINYLGDILIAISMSMPAGYSNVLPHLYPIYLTILLVNRAQRDDYRCRLKHQEAWEEYCSKVRYVMIPGIY